MNKVTKNFATGFKRLAIPAPGLRKQDSITPQYRVNSRRFRRKHRVIAGESVRCQTTVLQHQFLFWAWNLESNHDVRRGQPSNPTAREFAL